MVIARRLDYHIRLLGDVNEPSGIHKSKKPREKFSRFLPEAWAENKRRICYEDTNNIKTAMFI